MKRLIIATLCLLAACGRSGEGNLTGQESGSPQQNVVAASADAAASRTPPNPTTQEAASAVAAALNQVPMAIIRLGSLGTPEDCNPGTMNGGLITLCKVCVTLLSAPKGNAQLQNVVFEMDRISLPFKRAISEDQPTIAPVDGKSGVWVPQPLGPSDPLVVSTLRKRTMELGDITPKGLGVDQTGEIYDTAANRGAVWNIGLPGNRIIALFDNHDGENLAEKKIGTCGGAEPAT
ncbi:MAG: hypothetical protein ABIW83_09520 [Allosphingosinicella sp.]